jgi:pimeloyl-ACP methyl ester carboxylesterase
MLWVVSVSAGGAFAQLLALDFADRVRSLVLSTSGVLPNACELPPPTEEFARFLTTAHVDWSDATSVIEYLVAYARVLVGGQRPFDETAARELACRDVKRARNVAAAQNPRCHPGPRALARAPGLDHRADPGDPRGRGSQCSRSSTARPWPRRFPMRA